MQELYHACERERGQELDLKGFPSTVGEKLLETVPRGKAGILTHGKDCAPSVPLV